MENINAPGTSSGLESADSGRESADPIGIQVDDAFTVIESSLERAESQLRYGRRQEAEGAIECIKEARFLLAHYRAAQEGKQGS